MAKRKAERRRRFLDVATRLFGDHGYHNTTVPMIVEAADSSTGSFYFYFENKEDVFVAVLKRAGEELADRLNEAIDEAQDSRDRMRAAVEGLFLHLANDPRAARILLIESPRLGGRIEEVRQAIVRRHISAVAEALSVAGRGAFQRENELAAWCWVGAVHEAAIRWLECSPAARRPAAEVASLVASYNLGAVGLEA